MDVTERNLRNKFKHASRIGAKIAIIIGEEELEKDFVTVKVMEEGSQYTVDSDWIADYISKKLKEL